jgi:hypothetical protein
MTIPPIPTPAQARAALGAIRRDLGRIAGHMRREFQADITADTVDMTSLDLADVDRCLEAMEAREGALRAVLRRLEWSREHVGGHRCPACNGPAADCSDDGLPRHKADCRLAAALAPADGEPPP